MSATPNGKIVSNAARNREICFHGALQQLETEPQAFGQLINSLYETEWVVYAKPPFAGPEAVLKYLGRYTHRIAVSNDRITDLSGQTVSFTWKDYADNNRSKVMTLTHGEFIRRFLLHVLPTGFTRIRYFGFLGQTVKKEKLRLCRTLLGVLPPGPQQQQITEDEGDPFIEELREIKPRWYCPFCGKGLSAPSREIQRPQHRNIEPAAVA